MIQQIRGGARDSAVLTSSQMVPLWGGDHTLNSKELEQSRFKPSFLYTLLHSVQQKAGAHVSAWLCSVSSVFSSKSLVSQPLWGDMRGPKGRSVVWGCHGSLGSDT